MINLLFIKKQMMKIVLVNNEIRVLYIDKAGILWIGTRGGICTFDRKGKFYFI